MSKDGVSGWEDLSKYGLDTADEQKLLATQHECTFIWTNKQGHPLGAIVNYIERDGHLWLTATSMRPRVAAVRADPRVSVTISSKGSGITARQSITVKGTCVVHDDEATKEWFFPAFSTALRPGEPERAAEFARLLNSEHRVILEVVPIGTTRFDGAKMWQAAPSGAPTEGEEGFTAAP